MRFKDVVGYQDVKAKLIGQIRKGRVSHGQFFLGKDGGGNFALALAYAQYLNCENKQEDDSCGECPNCKKYENLQHPDLSFVFPNAIGPEVKEKPDSKKYAKAWRNFLLENSYFNLDSWCKQIEIDKKQPLINKADSEAINGALSLKSFEAPYKVVIIWYPEKMNLECANKILKTLEEPAENSLLLMVGHQLEELLPTIISRVQITKLPPLGQSDIVKRLMVQHSCDEKNARSIAKLSQGSFHNALSLLKDPGKDEFMIEQFQTWMRLCYKLEVAPLNEWVESMSKNGRELQKNFLSYCLRMFRQCMVYNYGDDRLLQLHHKEEVFLSNFAKFIHGGNIVDFNQEFNEAITGISRNGNPKMIFMSASLKVCNFLRYKV